MMIPFEKRLKDMPKEIMWYMNVTMLIHSVWGGMTSGEILSKLRSVEEKYPDWFPWETKYRSIPNEVHEAYFREKNQNFDKPLFGSDEWEGNEGIIPYLQKCQENAKVIKVEPATLESILKLMSDIYEADRQKKEIEFQNEKKARSLWNKHYKKYNLPYRDSK